MFSKSASATTDGHGDRSTTRHMALPVLYFLGIAQGLAGVVCFFAFNWRQLDPMVKIHLPIGLMGLGFLIWVVMPRRSRLGDGGAILASLMIGIAMGVVGQVYQLGADPWPLFAIWAGFLAVILVVLRTDGQALLFFAVATAGWFLFTGAEGPATSSRFPEWIFRERLLLYGIGAVGFLFIRSLLGAVPVWHSVPVTLAGFGTFWSAALNGVTRGAPSVVEWLAIFVFFAAIAAGLALYTRIRRDRPLRTLVLFFAVSWVVVYVIIERLPRSISSGPEAILVLSLMSFAVIAGGMAVFPALLRALNRAAGDDTYG